MKKTLLVAIIILLLMPISCKGKTSSQSGISASSIGNLEEGAVTAAVALEAFKKTKKVDKEVVPDVEAIVKAISGLSSSAINDLTKNYASSSGDFLYDLATDGKGVSIRKYNLSRNNAPVLIVPATIEDLPVTEIQIEAFWLTNFIGVVLPDTIIKIGATGKATSVAPVTFPSSLSVINFPSSLKEIGLSAFAFTNLNTAYLPEGLEILGEKAFTYCQNLTSVTFPSSIKEIHREAFYYSQSLTSAHLSEGLKIMDERAFMECRSLSSLTLPGSIKVIPSEAFWRTGITNLIIPEGVETIDGGAFGQCFRLQSVTLPSTIKEIRGGSTFDSSGAFSDCTNLTDIIIPDSIQSIAFVYVDNSEWGKIKPSTRLFEGSGKLKLVVRQRLLDLGYKGVF